MTSNIRKWFVISRELLGSLLFPKRCLVCDEMLTPEEAKKGIHLACESKLYPIYGAVCMHCGRPLGDMNPGNRECEYVYASGGAFDSSKEFCYDCIQKGYVSKPDSRYPALGKTCITQAKSLFLYKGAIKTSMYRFKYSNKREYADFFAKQAVTHYGAWMQRMGIDVIVPVPMYIAKQRKRGYNQAETFAKAISEQTGILVRTDLVSRVKDTTPQKGLNEKERKNNATL